MEKRRKGAKLAKGREGVFVSKRGVILSGTACIQQPLFLSLRPGREVFSKESRHRRRRVVFTNALPLLKKIHIIKIWEKR
jgi:hypothetical protein